MLHHRLGDLPADAQRRVERGKGFLKHGSDPPSEHPSALRRGKAGDVLTLEQDRTTDFGRGPEEVQYGAGDAALARSGFADDRERAARLEREADITHGGDLPVTVAISDREIADLEERFWRWRRRGAAHRRSAIRGSSTSRRPSPTRLIAMTVTLIAIPGASEIHGAVSTKARPLLIIRPQSEAGGCTPKPRKLRTAPSSTANTTRRLASTIRTGQTLGSSSRINM